MKTLKQAYFSRENEPGYDWHGRTALPALRTRLTSNDFQQPPHRIRSLRPGWSIERERDEAGWPPFPRRTTNSLLHRCQLLSASSFLNSLPNLFSPSVQTNAYLIKNKYWAPFFFEETRRSSLFVRSESVFNKYFSAYELVSDACFQLEELWCSAHAAGFLLPLNYLHAHHPSKATFKFLYTFSEIFIQSNWRSNGDAS